MVDERMAVKLMIKMSVWGAIQIKMWRQGLRSRRMSIFEINVFSQQIKMKIRVQNKANVKTGSG